MYFSLGNVSEFYNYNVNEQTSKNFFKCYFNLYIFVNPEYDFLK